MQSVAASGVGIAIVTSREIKQPGFGFVTETCPGVRHLKAERFLRAHADSKGNRPAVAVFERVAEEVVQNAFQRMTFNSDELRQVGFHLDSELTPCVTSLRTPTCLDRLDEALKFQNRTGSVKVAFISRRQDKSLLRQAGQLLGCTLRLLQKTTRSGV